MIRPFDEIKGCKREFRIFPQRICFEITETAAIDNLVDAVEFIAESRQHGFKFALDDFGVGLSSFLLPENHSFWIFLKIDGSFVTNMLENSIDRGIVNSATRLPKLQGWKPLPNLSK